MRFILLTCSILLIFYKSLFSQLIFEENFDYNNGILTTVSGNIWEE